jgi:hypothetical protein
MAADVVGHDVEDELLGVIDDVCGQVLESETGCVVGVAFGDIHRG